MKNYVQPGKELDIVAAGAFAAGSVVVVGSLIGVAATAASGAGAEAVVSLEGVYTLPKKSTDVIGQGDRVYWDASPGEVTSTAAGNKFLGFAWVAAGNGVTSMNVKLSGRGDTADAS